MRNSLAAWAFLLPAVLLISLSVLVPALMALVMSFTATGLDVSEPLRFVGLANLERLLSDPMARQVLVTTFLYLVGVVPPIVLGALALAVLVNQGLPGRSFLRGAFYTPVLVSIVVAAIAFRWLYAENGLINGWLSALLGDAFSPIGFLTTPQLALPSVMLVTLWKGLGYYMVIFLAGLQGIPQELYEAAELDGSEGWRKHLDITLPLMSPYVTSGRCGVVDRGHEGVRGSVPDDPGRSCGFHPNHRLLRVRPGLCRIGDQLRLHPGPGAVPVGVAVHHDPVGLCRRSPPDLTLSATLQTGKLRTSARTR